MEQVNIADDSGNVTERIIIIIQFFSQGNRTFIDWLNETHKDKSEEEPFFNMLLLSGFISIPRLDIFNSYISLYNDYSNRLLHVTKDGYSFLNSYKFNKQSMLINEQSLKINTHVKCISIVAIIISLTSLIISFFK